MNQRLAVNVDVDGLYLYHDIHGLPREGASQAAWLHGVPRFLDMFEAAGLRGTFFVVAENLHDPKCRAIAEDIVSRGHELASHSYSHPYDLIQRSDADVEREIVSASELLTSVRGSNVRGFRAPGYNIDDRMRYWLGVHGYSYDSSVFPCPPYYLARAAIISWLALRKRPSLSIVGDPAACLSARHPHRILRGPGAGLVEFPMTVLPGIRFPVIGTSMAILGATGMRVLSGVLRRLSFVNLEFHAIDLIDADDVPGSPLIGKQPDLARSVTSKRAAFEVAFAACSDAKNDTLEGFAADF
jgi:hypothetical protein